MYPLFCYPYPVLLINIFAILFGLGLAITTSQGWNVGQKLLLAFYYLLLLFSAIYSPDSSFKHEVSDVFLSPDSITFEGCPI
jgi:hypothetical protein